MTPTRHNWQDALSHKDMEVTAVCIGKVEHLAGAGIGGKDLTTAFRKKPTEGYLKVRKLGIIGDEIGNREAHGGVEQAIYVFGGDDYAWWEKELGRKLEPGAFGENLVISNLDTEDILLGDNLNFPDLVLEVSGPRSPCGKLAAMMDDKEFGVKFRNSRHCGFYCRVLNIGRISAGQKVTIEREAGSDIYISDMLQKKHK